MEEKGIDKGKPKFISASDIMRSIVEKAKTVAPFGINILITGETGVGKGVLARLIHSQSRREGKFIVLNSAGLPETLLESELFGYGKGAFTGANSNQTGFFEKARGGTLFLDEIGCMSLTAQSKILLAVEEREYYPVGSREKVSVDTRLISASNQPLRELIEKKRFRADLFYRLSEIHIYVPPLRERPEDIIALTSYFAEKSSAEFGKKRINLSEDVYPLFLGYGWPGNVRELENIIRRTVLLCQKSTLEADDFKFDGFDNSLSGKGLPQDSMNLKANVNKYKKNFIKDVLVSTGWNQTRAAKLLGIQRTYLSRVIKQYGINRPLK